MAFPFLFWSQNLVRDLFSSLADLEEEYSQLLMAFLGISRPALASLLLGLALSLQAALYRGGITKAKCTNPKVRLNLFELRNIF